MPPLPKPEALKIYFYECPPDIQSVNLFPVLVPAHFYYSNLVRFLKRYEVKDPECADFFFIPVNLVKFQYNLHFRDPGQYIEKLPFLGQKPHLLFAAGDFGQRKHSPHDVKTPEGAYPYIFPWLDERFILLAFNSEEDLLLQDIALFPYLLKDERFCIPPFRKGLFKKAPSQKRDLIFSFVGHVSYPDLPEEHIRGGKLNKLKKKRKYCFVGTPEESIRRFGRREGHHIRVFERSRFVLCPAGIGRWTFRVAEALSYGAIPVIISDGYILPFAKYIPWESCTLRAFEKKVLDIGPELRWVTESQMALFTENLAKNVGYFTEEANHLFLALELIHRVGKTQKKLSDLDAMFSSLSKLK